MHIPASSLSPETLRAIIEEFVSREGTDYGEQLYTLSQKVDEVHQLIGSGKAIIAFDPETESCTILPAGSAPLDSMLDGGALTTGKSE
jgi:uncharacterized protein YheU (UPF0270 family)